MNSHLLAVYLFFYKACLRLENVVFIKKNTDIFKLSCVKVDLHLLRVHHEPYPQVFSQSSRKILERILNKLKLTLMFLFLYSLFICSSGWSFYLLILCDNENWVPCDIHHIILLTSLLSINLRSKGIFHFNILEQASKKYIVLSLCIMLFARIWDCYSDLCLGPLN